MSVFISLTATSKDGRTPSVSHSASRRAGAGKGRATAQGGWVSLQHGPWTKLAPSEGLLEKPREMSEAYFPCGTWPEIASIK